MALQPTLSPLLIVGPPEAPNTLEFFLDYVCPFSAKSVVTIDTVLKPLFNSGGQYAGQVKVIFRNHVQPWHVTSMLTHEAALAVLRVAPNKFWAYSLALFKAQEQFFDIPTSELSPRQIREKLAELAESAAGVDKKAVLDLLTLKSTPNGGVAVTDDLKYTVKFGRQNSIHVSPTVLFNGLVVPEISSSWGKAEWEEWLAKKVKA